MVVFIRDNECFEPRLNNYLNYLNKKNIEYRIIAWNRNGMASKKDNISFFEKRAEYGTMYKNIPNKIMWMFFVFKELFKLKNKYDVIHACDIDAALPAFFANIFLNKKLIFDVFDWMSVEANNNIIYKIIDKFQNYVYKKADAIILCEEERKEQATATNKNIYTLPNIPTYKQIDFFDPEIDINKFHQKYKLVISYVGVFDECRGLENLLDAISERNDILLNIAGFGTIEKTIKSYSEKFDNIVFYGRVDYEKGQSIIKNSDLMYAMYFLSNPVHKYAAPNKFYESLICEIPLITTKDTLVGNKVNNIGTGYVIDEELKSLKELLNNISTDSLINKKYNCRNAWKNIYSSYFETFMETKYLKMITGDISND